MQEVFVCVFVTEKEKERMNDDESLLLCKTRTLLSSPEHSPCNHKPEVIECRCQVWKSIIVIRMMVRRTPKWYVLLQWWCGERRKSFPFCIVMLLLFAHFLLLLRLLWAINNRLVEVFRSLGIPVKCRIVLCHFTLFASLMTQRKIPGIFSDGYQFERFSATPTSRDIERLFFFGSQWNGEIMKEKCPWLLFCRSQWNQNIVIMYECMSLWLLLRTIIKYL